MAIAKIPVTHALSVIGLEESINLVPMYVEKTPATAKPIDPINPHRMKESGLKK